MVLHISLLFMNTTNEDNSCRQVNASFVPLA